MVSPAIADAASPGISRKVKKTSVTTPSAVTKSWTIVLPRCSSMRRGLFDIDVEEADLGEEIDLDARDVLLARPHRRIAVDGQIIQVGHDDLLNLGIHVSALLGVEHAADLIEQFGHARVVVEGAVQ